MAYTKTMFCERSGISLTIIDDFAHGNYETFRSHPQLENLHSIIQRYKCRAPKSYLAGGILLTLQDCKRFAYSQHYPKNLMAMLNLELCSHSADFLYSMYEKVQTFCYGKSIVREAQFNLMQANGRWGIVHAIKVLIGEPETIPSNQYQHAAQVAAAMFRQKDRAKVSLKFKPAAPTAAKDKLGNMNLDKIIARVQGISRKLEKMEPTKVREVEQEVGKSLSSANVVLPSYVMASEENREAMALLYKSLATMLPEKFRTKTILRSFERVVELLRDLSTTPVEISDGAELDLSDLEI